MLIRSLRVRVATYLLIPMAVLAMAMAAASTWFVDTFITETFDRVLAASVISISERLIMQDSEVTVDVPTAAFGMLSNEERDSIFYSVTADGAFVTGYEDFPPPRTSTESGVVRFRDEVFRGRRVRVATLSTPIYVTKHVVLIQVAQTTDGRDNLANRMLLALAVLGSLLAGVGCLLIWFSVRGGLTPLDRLRREVEFRKLDRGVAVSPFPVHDVPRETLPLISALNELLGQLNQSMDVMRQFVADASHQLRTPVAILKTHLALLDRHPPGSQLWLSSRFDIDAAVSRLNRLVAQLLVLAQAEECPATNVGKERHDLVALARTVTFEQADIARRADIDLSFEGPDTPLFVQIDRIFFEEALRNLIDNAVRYNSAGGKVCVRVCDRQDGSTSRKIVEVEDDGPGIPEREIEAVFERFYRVARPGDPGGSGLGLAIVRAFAERIDASVALSPGTQRGLVATISLP